MARTNEAAAIETVLSSVQFTVNTGETPVSLVKNPGEGAEDRKGTFEWRDIVVHDARPMADQIDLDGEGFEFVNYETAVENFLDDDEVRRVYYPEMERLVIEATGCAKVIVFDHTVRVGDEAKQAAHKVRAPVRVVHNDFTLDSAPQRVRDFLPENEAEAALQRRFAIIQTWRSIAPAVESEPLAMCDGRTIPETGFIRNQRRYRNRIGETYHITYNPSHRWFYFPQMPRNEALVFKVFDTDASAGVRFTAHTAFTDPTSPPDAKPRESIEMRALAFF